MIEILYYSNNDRLFEITNKKYCLTNISFVSDVYSLCNMSRFFGGRCFINRLDYGFNFPVKFSHTPIPKEYQTNLSFEDVCLTVAEEIWKKTDNVSLFWSGGIDSTTILVSLMMTNSNWKNCIEIYTDKISIEKEYPFFYDTFLKDTNVRIFETKEKYNYLSYYKKELFENKYVTDGNCGDWLWTCGIINNYSNNINKDYKVIYDKIKSDYSIKYPKVLINYIERVVSFSPVKIKSIFDLSWWIAFTHRWDYNKITHTLNLGDLNYLYAMKPFFDHELFQKWSMSNHDKKIKDTLTTLKWPAKDLIYKYTKDENYRTNKKQTNSIAHQKYYTNNICIVNENNIIKTIPIDDIFKL